MKDSSLKALNEAIAVHLEMAGRSFKRSILVSLAICVGGALVASIVTGNLMVGPILLMFILPLVAAIPLATRYANVSQVRNLSRKLAQDPDLVYAAQSEGIPFRGLLGSLSVLAIYGDLQRVLLLAKGMQCGLMLPAKNVKALLEAFPASEVNYEVALAEAKRLMGA